MASPFCKTPEAFSEYVEADSGVSTAKITDDQNQLLPLHSGAAAAAKPPGLSKVSGGGMVLAEQGGHGNEGIPLLEMTEEPLTLSPAVQGDTLLPITNGHGPQQETPPLFSVGEMVSPKEEVSTPGSTGADKMVGSERAPQDAKEEYETTINSLRKQLESSNEKNSVLQISFEVVKEEYETIIADRNAEIEKLKTEKEEYRVRFSKVQRSNDKEREVYKAKIDHLTLKLQSKEEEIDCIKKEFKAKERKHHEEKAALEKEVSRIEVEFKTQEVEHVMVKAVLTAEKAELRTEIAEQKLIISEMKNAEVVLQGELDKANKDTAVAERTIAEERQKKAENEAARIKEENDSIKAEKKELERQISVQSFTSSRSDSSASSTSERRTSDVARSDSSASSTSERRTSDVHRPLTLRLNSQCSVTSSGSSTNAGVKEELKEEVCGQVT